MNHGSLLGRTRQSLSEFWATRNARERRMIGLAGLMVLAAVAYAVTIAPALSGRQRLSVDLPVLREQVARMQALSRQAAELSGAPATPSVVMTKESIEGSLSHDGLKAQNVTVSEGVARVQFATTSFAGTMIWLDEVQKAMLVSVVDAHVAALAQPDMVTATFTLRSLAHD